MKKKIFLIEKKVIKNNNLKIRKERNCPECGELWFGDDIFEYFLKQKTDPNTPQHECYKDKTDKEILETANMYGWSKEHPVKFNNIIGVELAYDDPEHYDGISYWQCPGCGVAWHRFTGVRSERFIKDIKNEKRR